MIDHRILAEERMKRIVALEQELDQLRGAFLKKAAQSSSAGKACYQCGSSDTYVSPAGYNTAIVCRSCHAEEHAPSQSNLDCCIGDDVDGHLPECPNSHYGKITDKGFEQSIQVEAAKAAEASGSSGAPSGAGEPDSGVAASALPPASQVAKSDENLSAKLHSTMDARVWTQAFMETIERRGLGIIDEGLMIGWFANAIMCGHDIAHQRMAESTRNAEHAMFGKVRVCLHEPECKEPAENESKSTEKLQSTTADVDAAAAEYAKGSFTDAEYSIEDVARFAFRAGAAWKARPDKQAAELERHKAYLENLEDLLRKSGKREDQYNQLAKDNWNRYRTLLSWLPQDMQKEALEFMDGMIAPGGTLPEDAQHVEKEGDRG